jgi:hypothetical protein
MADRYRDEKEEEKEQEKRGEKEEKETGEKWRRDPLSAAVWAGILIWAGLVLLAYNLHLLDRLEKITPWGIVFLGAGALLLLEALVRYTMPEYRRPLTGLIILGVVFVGIGLENLIGISVVGPLVLIVVGASIVLRQARRRPPPQ